MKIQDSTNGTSPLASCSFFLLWGVGILLKNPILGVFSRWFQPIFLFFTPDFVGEMIQFDNHIFEMGWIYQRSFGHMF